MNNDRATEINPRSLSETTGYSAIFVTKQGLVKQVSQSRPAVLATKPQRAIGLELELVEAQPAVQ